MVSPSILGESFENKIPHGLYDEVVESQSHDKTREIGSEPN